MGFRKAVRGHHQYQNAPVAGKVRIARTARTERKDKPVRRPTGRAVPYHISIRIPRDVLLALRWKSGDRIAILFGTGSDEGIIKLERLPASDPTGYSLSKWNESMASAEVRYTSSEDLETMFPRSKEYGGPIVCEHEITRSGLTVLWGPMLNRGDRNGKEGDS